jgi:hypothetical protein
MKHYLVKLLMAVVFVAFGFAAGGQVKLTTVAEAWQFLPQSGSACDEEDLSFDYGIGGGMRNFFCRALTIYSWQAFLASAPVPPFRSGPHRDGKLDLNSEQDFGYYNPKFVVWATNSLIPAAESPLLRRKTQGVYDDQVAELAHTYFLVYQKLSSNPALAAVERQRYLDSIETNGGGWDASEVIDSYNEFLGDADSNWGGHDPNLVRSSVMWWLRRQEDATASLWHTGLIKLLATYDSAWLKEQNTSATFQKWQAPLIKLKPEYK